jgi:hypothetical protein
VCSSIAYTARCASAGLIYTALCGAYTALCAAPWLILPCVHLRYLYCPVCSCGFFYFPVGSCGAYIAVCAAARLILPCVQLWGLYCPVCSCNAYTDLCAAGWASTALYAATVLVILPCMQLKYLLYCTICGCGAAHLASEIALFSFGKLPRSSFS